MADKDGQMTRLPSQYLNTLKPDHRSLNVLARRGALGLVLHAPPLLLVLTL
jgi:hypothetical protein